MALRNSEGCACRVPLEETVAPSFATHGEVLAWLAERGIDVRPDFRGRLSIPVADAQRLWEESAEAAAAEVARLAEIRSQAYVANRERPEVASKAFHAALVATLPSDPKAARAAAIEAVRTYDAQLPRDVRPYLEAVDVNGCSV